MTTDHQQDLHTMSGAYALDALDDLERVRFEKHLATCADCQEEVAGFVETAVLLSSAATLTPPPALRDRVLADISKVRPLPPVVVPDPRRTAELQEYAAARSDLASHRRRRSWASIASVAAAVALVLGVGIGVVTRPWEDTTQSQVADPMISSVLNASDAVSTRESLGGGTATVTRSKLVGRAVVQLAGVKAPSAKVYQLWLLRGQLGRFTPTSAGLLSRSPDQTVVLQGDASTAFAAAITEEPAGGSAQPTTDPTVFPFPTST